MQKISGRIASSISEQLHYDEEKSAVIAYGLLAIMQVTVIMLYTVLFGVLTKTLLPALLINLSGGVLRSFSGGAHAGSMATCICISFAVISAGAACSVYLLPAVPGFPAAVVLILLFSILFFIAFKYIPVDSPNKPIRRPEKIRRLRRQSFAMLAVLFAACAAFLTVFMLTEDKGWYALFWALLLAAAWQVWTLTLTGRKLLALLDALLGGKAES